jgi:preprotein translocase subunit SecY|tara:strand:- start:488 stop:1759 length:1272 start_codon:yes stop_codon:yes gene_type:complete
MAVSETISLLQKKVVKIFGLLILVRLGLYIPVPNVDLDIFSQSQGSNPLFGIAKNLTGSSFLGIGALGILPYINSSIVIQLLTPIIPKLEQLQKEEGELGRQQISRYTRYLTFGWALILSTGIAFFFVKPLIFNWSTYLAFKIIVSLTTGSMLSMWFAELITNEKLGNGSSMIIFINIIGGIPANLGDFLKNLNNTSNVNNFLTLLLAYAIYLIIVSIIVIVQDSYKKVNIVSARQLSFNSLDSNPQGSELKNSYIPIKLNQGGIMPLVFSTTIATFLFYPLQLFITGLFSISGNALTSLLTFSSFTLNIILVVFFSSFYALLVLKPKDLSENLTKMAYNIPGLKQGKETTQYLEQVISRLAFMGGLFLAFLAFFPIVLANVFQFNIFKNLTSLIILIGVITDVSSQIRGFLVSQNYESFKKA